MGKLTLVTGGSRSGKSAFAEKLLTGKNDVYYLATGIAFDEEMKDRIAKHQSSRNKNWETIEAYKDIDVILKNKIENKKYLFIDCITIMISNLMILDNNVNWDNADNKTVNDIENKIKKEIDKLLMLILEFSGETIIVTNELGMGLVPPTPLGRHYRDIAGRMNQIIAGSAHVVYLIISGIPVKIKG